MSKEKCSDKHDTLYHYTTMDGFRGIMKTQTLWATHYQHLNDTSELARLTPVLTDLLVPTVKRFTKELRAKVSNRVKVIIRKHGSRDAFARHEARTMSNLFYEGAFTPIQGNKHPLFEPFITSFCTHLDDEYTSKHGLLSMWRSYGLGGGVALVMDTAKLENYLFREAENFGYSDLSLSDVIYEGDSKGFFLEFGAFIKLAKEKMYEHFTVSDIDYDDFLPLYLSCVSRFKHQAFKEEREVRIVAMPWTKLSVEGLPGEDKKFKPELTCNGNVRRLALFDGEKAKAQLPIKNIIVGPHREQEKRFEEIKRATKHLPDVEVTRSETPYIESK